LLIFNHAVLFKEALADAKAKDAAVAAGEKPEGEFFGLPCSFKGESSLEHACR
jgi:hypothetical protein